jgi:hypothetical protein
MGKTGALTPMDQVVILPYSNQLTLTDLLSRLVPSDS